MAVDYVRLYQTKATPVTFNASFHEDFAGLEKISLPFSAFPKRRWLSAGYFEYPNSALYDTSWSRAPGAA
ncbi:MAG: hypothetical protein M0C28_34550 [Candidatus Moduliflexus flocculans]|nr:hypothetical protein [Candidatus Moduliflexus flocculans]